ncbi:MAG: SPOR domain-containing protein [Sodaliphilus sp.]
MKRIRNRHSFYSFALAMLIALVACGASVAQVSVNAPNALKKRTNAPEAKKQDPKPAAKAPAQGQHKAAGKKGDSGAAVAPNGSVSGTTATGVVSGYRVQVLFTSAKNGRTLAQQRARKIALKYPQYRSYMTYVAPRWRLRIGDFRKYDQARSFANLIKRNFPEMRADVAIVGDKIKIYK